MSIDIIYVFLTDISNETNINYLIAISNEITGGYEQGVIGKLLVMSCLHIFYTRLGWFLLEMSTRHIIR